MIKRTFIEKMSIWSFFVIVTVAAVLELSVIFGGAFFAYKYFTHVCETQIADSELVEHP